MPESSPLGLSRFQGSLRTFDSKGGAKLETTIENPTPFPLPKCQEYGVIHGLTTNGHKVSLIDCFDLKGPGWSSSGITSKLIFANLVFDGFHTPLDKPANLSKLWARFPMLTNWVGMSCITVKREPDRMEEFDISCRKLPKISFQVDDTLKVEIQIGLSSLPWEGPNSELNLRNQVWVTVHSTPSRPYREMLDVLMTLEAFFTFACHSLCEIEDIRAIGDFDPTLNADGSLRYPTAEVLYTPVFKAEKEHAHHPARFLFRFADVKDDIESIIRIWLQNANKLRPVIALYQSALYGERTYLESEFLSMVQAVEVFHRRFRGGYYTSPDEFEQTILPKLREAVPAETANELRNVILNKLQYLNEYSLGRRLRELIRDHESLILEFVPDAYPLIDKIVQFRNHFTHYSGDKALSESDIRKIVHSVDVLRLILELSLLKELHMSPDTLARLVHENRIYSHVKQTSPKHLSNQDDSSQKKTGD